MSEQPEHQPNERADRAVLSYAEAYRMVEEAREQRERAEAAEQERDGLAVMFTGLRRSLLEFVSTGVDKIGDGGDSDWWWHDSIAQAIEEILTQHPDSDRARELGAAVDAVLEAEVETDGQPRVDVDRAISAIRQLRTARSAAVGRGRQAGARSGVSIMTCDRCGSVMIQRYTGVALMSNPPQYPWRWWCGCGNTAPGGIEQAKTDEEIARERWEAKNREARGPAAGGGGE